LEWTGSLLDKTMKAKILSIESDKKEKQFQVIVLIGNKKHQFTLTVEIFTVANHTIESVRGNYNFLEVFRFTQNLAVEIYNIVLKVYHNQQIDLPIELGNFCVEEFNLVS
jgi:hypothetical protein